MANSKYNKSWFEDVTKVEIDKAGDELSVIFTGNFLNTLTEIVWNGEEAVIALKYWKEYSKNRLFDIVIPTKIVNQLQGNKLE